MLNRKTAEACASAVLILILMGMKNKGFTLIELLVVIAIIGILSSIVLASLNIARKKGKMAKARVELHDLRTAMYNLANDTGRISNGCTLGVIDSPETTLDSAWAGLLAAPTTGADPTYSPNPGNCGWTASSISQWNGPYTTNVMDPWGRAYVFDPDYFIGSPPVATQVLLSRGPDGVINTAGADDVVLKLSPE